MSINRFNHTAEIQLTDEQIAALQEFTRERNLEKAINKAVDINKAIANYLLDEFEVRMLKAESEKIY